VQPTSREATMHVRCQMQWPTTRVFPRACFVQRIAVCVAFLGEAASPGLTNRASVSGFNIAESSVDPQRWGHEHSRMGMLNRVPATARDYPER
jgi:hypothetical protein